MNLNNNNSYFARHKNALHQSKSRASRVSNNSNNNPNNKSMTNIDQMDRDAQ